MLGIAVELGFLVKLKQFGSGAAVYAVPKHVSSQSVWLKELRPGEKA